MIYEEFCPVQEGDGISVSGIVDGNKLMVKKHPLVKIPEDQDSITKFIFLTLKNSKTCTGIKLTDAKKLVEDLFEENDPIGVMNSFSLGKVPADSTFSLKEYMMGNQRDYLLRMWKEKRLVRQLHLLGLYNAEIRASSYRADTVYEQLCENPYKVLGISLEKADSIVETLGLDLEPIDRECGDIIRRINDFNKKNGWTSTPIMIALQTFGDFSRLSVKLVKDYGVTMYNERLYLKHVYEAEKEVAEYIIRVKHHASPEVFPATNNPKMSDEQNQIITDICSENISMICGEAGSGKTTLIKEIVDMFTTNGFHTHLLAFVGKAVSRIREVLPDGIGAFAIHSFCARGVQILKDDVIIIDEISMVTTALMHYLIGTLGNKRLRFVFVGDINQLPPIGWGYMMRELIKSGMVKTFYLTENFRVKNAVDRGMYENIQRVLHPPECQFGDADYREFNFVNSLNFRFIESNSVDLLVEQYMSFYNQGYDKNQVTGVAPYNKTLAEPNNIIEDQVIPEDAKAVTDHKGVIWYIGSRVMVTNNCYKTSPSVMNGEEGEIVEEHSPDYLIIEIKGHRHKVLLTKTDKNNYNAEEDSVISLSTDDLIKSYVITIHKSEGSEYKAVVVFLPKGCSRFVTRNMLYTAMSRAKENLVVIGNIKDVRTIVYNEVGDLFDGLAEMIERAEREYVARNNQEVQGLVQQGYGVAVNGISRGSDATNQRVVDPDEIPLSVLMTE